MYQLAACSGFQIFVPAPGIIPEAEKMIAENQKKNTAFLSGFSASGGVRGAITGSFICAHAPDYAGLPTLTWGIPEWRALFSDMKSSGLDTAVFQASVWNELGECYYRSSYFREFRQWDVVEPMLAAANLENISIFLGGYGSVSGWSGMTEDGAVNRETERQLACMSELLNRFGTQFSGIYFSPETAFTRPRDLRREQRLNRLYRAYFSELKRIAPEKKILMSPATVFLPDSRADFLDCWTHLLAGVPLDILAPQDSIGCAACSLEDQREMWSRWKLIAEHYALRLWANIELFERRSLHGENPFSPASSACVQAQIANTAPFVEKHICWEYPYFCSVPSGGSELKNSLF